MVIASIGVYKFWKHIPPTQIEAIYDTAMYTSDTAFIVLKNPPKSKEAILDFWDKNKQRLAQKYHIIPGYPKVIAFYNNNYEKRDDSKFQFCFNEVLKDKYCINDKETILLIIKKSTKEYVFAFLQSHCALTENDKGKRSSFICPKKKSFL